MSGLHAAAFLSAVNSGIFAAWSASADQNAHWALWAASAVNAVAAFFFLWGFRADSAAKPKPSLTRSILFHEFLAHVLFQIREYLTSITTASQHLSAISTDPAAKDLAEKLTRMLKELSTKVSRMFETLEQNTTHRKPPRPAEFSLDGLIREAVRAAAAGRPIKTTVSIDPAIPMMSGDQDDYLAALSSAVENSFDAADDARAAASIAILARANSQRGQAEIEIIDDAGGIPPGDMGRILTPLFTTKAKQGALGIGLSMSRRLLERVGGTLEIASSNGRTTVRLFIPFKPGLPMIRNDESTWAGRRSQA